MRETYTNKEVEIVGIRTSTSPTERWCFGVRSVGTISVLLPRCTCHIHRGRENTFSVFRGSFERNTEEPEEPVPNRWVDKDLHSPTTLSFITVDRNLTLPRSFFLIFSNLSRRPDRLCNSNSVYCLSSFNQTSQHFFIKFSL